MTHLICTGYPPHSILCNNASLPATQRRGRNHHHDEGRQRFGSENINWGAWVINNWSPFRFHLPNFTWANARPGDPLHGTNLRPFQHPQMVLPRSQHVSHDNARALGWFCHTKHHSLPLHTLLVLAEVFGHEEEARGRARHSLGALGHVKEEGKGSK